MTSDQIYNDINGLEGELRNAVINDPTTIYQNLASKVNNFAPQYDELGRLQADAYATPVNMMNEYWKMAGPNGQQAGQYNPFAMLSNIFNETGRRYGSRDSLSNTISGAKGRIEDMANTIFQQGQLGRQGILDRINIKQNLLPGIISAEENARKRADNVMNFDFLKEMEDKNATYKDIGNSFVTGADRALGTGFKQSSASSYNPFTSEILKTGYNILKSPKVVNTAKNLVKFGGNFNPYLNYLGKFLK